MRQFIQAQLCALILAANIRLNPGDEAELRRLAKSYLNRPIHPIVCRPDLTVLDGSRRVLGMRLELGEKSNHKVDCVVSNEDLTLDQIAKLQFICAVHRKDLTGYEKCMAAVGFETANPGVSHKQLAEELGIDASYLPKLLAIKDCVEVVRQALKDELIGLRDMHNISLLAPEEQPVLLAAKLNGASADEVGRQSRKRRNGSSGQAARLSRVKIAMPDAMLVISGKELSMADVVELLSETLKEARKAAEQYDVKTFQSMMRDKSKAG